MSRPQSYRRSAAYQQKQKQCLEHTRRIARKHAARIKQLAIESMAKRERRKTHWSEVFPKFRWMNTATIRSYCMAAISMFSAACKTSKSGKRSNGSLIPRVAEQFAVEGLEDRRLLVADIVSMSDDTGLSPTDAITTDQNIILQGTADPSSTVQVAQGGFVQGSTTADGDGNWTFDHTAVTLTENSHTFTASDGTVSGNFVVVVDLTAPGAPGTPDVPEHNSASVINAAEASDGTDITVDISTTGAAVGDRLRLEWDSIKQDEIIDAVDISNGSVTFSLSQAEVEANQDVNTVTATMTDLAGNDSTSTSTTVNVDTVAPVLDSFERKTPATSPTNADSLTFEVTFDEDVTGVDVLDFLVTGTTASISSITGGPAAWDVTISGGDLAAIDGTVGLDLAPIQDIVDIAGNDLPLAEPATDETYLVDNTAPAAPSTPDLDAASDTLDPNGTPLIGSDTDNNTSDNTPTFSGTAEANSLVRLFADDGSGAVQVGTTNADGSGDWSITSSTLSDDTYDITATATDTAGNVSAASSALSVTIDTALIRPAPSTPDLDAASDTLDPNGTPLIGSDTDNNTSDNTPTFSGTAEANSLVRLFADDGSGAVQVGTTTADGSGDWSITSSTLSDDTYDITATATDTAGNVSAASSALSVTIDTAAPAAPSTPDLDAASDTLDPNGTPLIGSDTDNNTSDNTPTFSGTAEANSLVRLFAGRWFGGGSSRNHDRRWFGGLVDNQ